ncbi:MAG: hypothetical protein EA403_01155 [Spirochaetaceae bacterium]|nr:MAG: hypothetical protein EA403_01155 [Spirochaetaceae bacterium]
MNSLIRGTSVIVIMLIVGLGWSKIGAARLRKRGVAEAEAKSQASAQAKKFSIIAAFLYMVSMVSIAGLFM